MKKIICLSLVCLIFAGCGKEAAPGTQTIPTPYEAVQPTLSPTEPESAEEILAYRRKIVVDEMQRIMGTLWTPAEDIVYYRDNPAEVSGEENVPLTLKAGRIYQGVPYTHASGAGYSFFSYASGQDENGVYTISGLGTEDLTGDSRDSEGNMARIGNDCADAVLWSWGRISNSYTAKYTAELTEFYGLVKVGEYQCDVAKFTTTTKPIVKENGEDVMFAAYNAMLPGDALVLFTKSAGGHAVMVTDTHVQYTPEGKIDGEKSYAVITEQNSAQQRSEKSYYNEELGRDVYLCGETNMIWTFNTLFSKGYLPVTCKELVDPAPLAPQSAVLANPSATMDDLFNTAIETSYRIAYVTITVSNAEGIVQQATAYGRENSYFRFDMYTFQNEWEKPVMKGAFDLSLLTAGQYQCKVVCRLSTGNQITVFDQTFEIT